MTQNTLYKHRLLIVFVLLGFLTVISVSPGHTEEVDPEHFPILFKDDFESATVDQLPAPWEEILTSNSPDVPVVIRAPEKVGATSGKQVLRLSRTADTNRITGQAVVTFPPAKERLRVSFAMYTDTSLRNLRVSLGGSGREAQSVHTAYDHTAIFFVTHNGRFRALVDTNPSKWMTGGYYTTEQWINVTFDIDIVAGLYDVYIEDTTIPANDEPLLFNSNEYDDLNTIAFAYQTLGADDNTVPVYIDDVIIRGQ